MRNITRVGLITISALLLAACTAKIPVGNENQANQPTATPAEQNTSFSMRDLIGMDKDQTCTFAVASSDGSATTSTSGTVYVSGTKIAENLQIVSSDKKVATQNINLISDGTYMYTYGNTSKVSGMKFQIAAAPTGTTNTDTQTQGADMNKKVNMQCSAWTVDTSKFTVPSNVNFTDITALMQKAKTAVTATPTVSSGDE